MTTFRDVYVRVADNTRRGIYSHGDEIKRLTNDAYREVCALVGPTEKSATVVLTAGVGDYSLTTLGITDLTAIRVVGYTPIAQQGYPLEPSTEQEIRVMRGFSQSSSDFPRVYAMKDLDTFQIQPLPSEAGSLNITYWSRPADLVNDTDTFVGLPLEWLDLVELLASSKGARPNFPILASDYDAAFQSKLEEYRKWRNARVGGYSRRLGVRRVRNFSPTRDTYPANRGY